MGGIPKINLLWNQLRVDIYDIWCIYYMIYDIYYGLPPCLYPSSRPPALWVVRSHCWQQCVCTESLLMRLQRAGKMSDPFGAPSQTHGSNLFCSFHGARSDWIFCYIKSKIAWGVLGSFETKIIGLYPQLFMANTNICSLLSHYYWLNPSAWLLIFQL